MIIGFLKENDEFENRSMLLPEHVSVLIKFFLIRACRSLVECCVDIVEVASSILAMPTRKYSFL